MEMFKHCYQWLSSYHSFIHGPTYSWTHTCTRYMWYRTTHFSTRMFHDSIGLWNQSKSMINKINRINLKRLINIEALVEPFLLEKFSRSSILKLPAHYNYHTLFALPIQLLTHTTVVHHTFIIAVQNVISLQL